MLQLKISDNLQLCTELHCNKQCIGTKCLAILTFLGEDAGVEVRREAKMSGTLQEAKEQDFEISIGNIVMEKGVKGLWSESERKRQ